MRTLNTTQLEISINQVAKLPGITMLICDDKKYLVGPIKFCCSVAIHGLEPVTQILSSPNGWVELKEYPKKYSSLEEYLSQKYVKGSWKNF